MASISAIYHSSHNKPIDTIFFHLDDIFHFVLIEKAGMPQNLLPCGFGDLKRLRLGDIEPYNQASMHYFQTVLTLGLFIGTRPVSNKLHCHSLFSRRLEPDIGVHQAFVVGDPLRLVV